MNTPTTSPPPTSAATNRPQRTTTIKNPKLSKTKPISTIDIEDIVTSFSIKQALDIRKSLLTFYDINKRDLPWRSVDGHDDVEEEIERRAYGVWVSEVMLQQTRVQTVIGYFNRWMEKWPTVLDLSRASIEEVNEMWAGLGYYRRARFLLEGAKMIIEKGGVFPKTVSDLRKVRGIGDYTAGAIASIAFQEAVPLVDGNVVRVIARLKAISENPKHSATVKIFWKLAGELVDPYRPGDFNQALMELGATLCTPTDPNCSSCPVSTHCCALSLSKKHESSLVTDFPIKVIKAKQRHEFSAVSVVEIRENNGNVGEPQYILIKRPEKGLLAGLWEFPSILLGKEADLATRRNVINGFLKKYFSLDLKNSCKVVSREDIGEYVHIFSHIRLKMYVELLIVCPKEGGESALKGKAHSKDLIWKCVDSKTLSSMGLTSGVRKVYSMVQNFKQINPETSSDKARKKNIQETSFENASKLLHFLGNSASVRSSYLRDNISCFI